MARKIANTSSSGSALSNPTMQYWNKQLGGQIASKASTSQRIQNMTPPGTNTVRKAPAPPAPAKPASRSTSRSSSGGGAGGSYGGGGSYFGSGGDGYGALSTMTDIPTEEDYLKGDATYQATISALAKQLANFNTDIDTQLANRKIDYDKALQQLGYISPVDGATEGTWNFEDQMTAAGRAYQAMLNDFASRGMIQSSGYGEAQNDLTRTLNDQYAGLKTSNDQFTSDMNRQKTKAADDNTAAQQAARAEAILRRAAQYGFGG